MISERGIDPVNFVEKLIKAVGLISTFEWLWSVPSGLEENQREYDFLMTNMWLAKGVYFMASYMVVFDATTYCDTKPNWIRDMRYATFKK